MDRITTEKPSFDSIPFGKTSIITLNMKFALFVVASLIAAVCGQTTQSYYHHPSGLRHLGGAYYRGAYGLGGLGYGYGLGYGNHAYNLGYGGHYRS
ncbi:hypothetical protein BLA29_010410, partial [Euroglyphus maynei]